MKKILVMNGPNLNLTGIRKKNVYGDETLEDINRELAAYGEGKGVQVDFYQSNHEGALIDKIHASRTDYDGVVLNAGALHPLFLMPFGTRLRQCRTLPLCGGAHERYSPAGGFSPDFRADPGVREANLRFWQRQLQNGY